MQRCSPFPMKVYMITCSPWSNRFDSVNSVLRAIKRGLWETLWNFIIWIRARLLYFLALPDVEVVVETLRLLMIYAIGMRNTREMCHSEVNVNDQQTYTAHPS